MLSNEDRLKQYVDEYAQQVWGDDKYGKGKPKEPTAEDLISIEVRSDSYANAHVEGEHESHDPPICRYKSARECGERAAAAEHVECS